MSQAKQKKNPLQGPVDFGVVGIDEVGRGALAGPVVAAAVVLKKNYDWDFLQDSKLLSAKQRQDYFPSILKHSWAIGLGWVFEWEIQRYNIAQASLLAMRKAYDLIGGEKDQIWVDGPFKIRQWSDKNVQYVVKGDQKIKVIAAASIVAKVLRDSYMENVLQAKEPRYLWGKNKGYGTLEHRQLIQKYGLTIHHREKFCRFYNKAKASKSPHQ